MKLFLHILIGCYLLAPTASRARNFRVDQIPNGAKFSCSTCHLAGGQPCGNNSCNPFGKAVEATLGGNITTAAVQWNAPLAQADADGDGYVNGLELGEPTGNTLTPVTTSIVSNPGVPTSTLCGGGTIEGPEQCDKTALNNKQCKDVQGFFGGTLACTATCQFDTAACNTCGNLTVEGAEDCDGNIAAADTCESLSYTGGGTLTCNPTTCLFDTINCVGGCGNNLLDPNEECDGPELDGETCKTLLGSTFSGSLSCKPNTCTFDKTGCTDTLVDPGNNDNNNNDDTSGITTPASQNTKSSSSVATTTGTGCSAMNLAPIHLLCCIFLLKKRRKKSVDRRTLCKVFYTSRGMNLSIFKQTNTLHIGQKSRLCNKFSIFKSSKLRPCKV